MEIKNISVDMKIKNIEELKTLIEEMQSIFDKIQKFKFDFEFNQCEHN